jgi:glycosyltransferase involved in cell wall biosynthesis
VSNRVFVFLTSFNHFSFLNQAIKSVLTQTYSDFKLTIWDDNSSDRSWDIIKEINDDRVQKFKNDITKRAIVGINQSISELAHNDLIAIHHSDDVWEPTKLKKQLAFMEANPKIGAVFTWAQPINEDGTDLIDENHHYFNVFNQPNRSQAEWLRFFFLQGNALCHPSILIRKKCYDDCGLYRYGFAQLTDLDMWVRLCMKFPIHVIPEKLVKFRVHTGEKNTSGNRPESRVRTHYEFLKVLENYRTIKDFDFFAEVFPEVHQYCTRDNFDIDYALARVTLELKHYPFHALFAQNLLFEKILNPIEAQKLKEHFNFTYLDFIEFTGQNDIFGIENGLNFNNLKVQYQNFEIQYQNLEKTYLNTVKLLNETQSNFENLNSDFQNQSTRLSAIENSNSWKLTYPIRFIGNLIKDFFA